jgi:hypothetical protein
LPSLFVTVVRSLEFGWRNVAAVFVETAVVEPVDPFQGGDLDVVGGAPWPSRFDQFGLVEAVDRLGEGIVIAVTNAADGGLDTRLRQALGVFD